MLTGDSVIVAVAVLVVSAALVAVSVIVCALLMEAGAVYSPLLDTVPTFGESDQLIVVLLEPVTVPVNGCVCPALSETDVGDTETVTGVCPPE